MPAFCLASRFILSICISDTAVVVVLVLDGGGVAVVADVVDVAAVVEIVKS